MTPAPQSPPSGEEGEVELDWSTFDGPTLNPGWTPDLQELIYTALNVLEHNGDEDDDAAEQIIERLLQALRSATTAERERNEARAALTSLLAWTKFELVENVDRQPWRNIIAKCEAALNKEQPS